VDISMDIPTDISMDMSTDISNSSDTKASMIIHLTTGADSGELQRDLAYRI